jgi:hypothetical protein
MVSSFHSYMANLPSLSLANAYIIWVHRDGSMLEGTNLPASRRYCAQFV